MEKENIGIGIELLRIVEEIKKEIDKMLRRKKDDEKMKKEIGDKVRRERIIENIERILIENVDEGGEDIDNDCI